MERNNENTITYGDWQIIRTIGQGASGTVYEIEKRDQFGDVFKAALKVISIPQSAAELKGILNEFDEDKEAVSAFLWGEVENIDREVKLMYQLRGLANIVGFLNHEIKPKEDSLGWNVLIEMELLTSLTEYAKKNGLMRSDIINIGIGICSALEYCSKLNIIHRDIKPDNILVNNMGVFKLADFGIARIIEKTMSGLSQRKGTYNYMAPEVYNGDEYGFGVDIYSLGMVLYRYLNNNKAPFRPQDHQPSHSEIREGLKRRMSGEPLPAPCNADPELARVVLKACAGNPKDRYRTPSEMKLDLLELLKDKKKDVLIMPPRQNLNSTVSADSNEILLRYDHSDQDSSLNSAVELKKSVQEEAPANDPDKTILLRDGNEPAYYGESVTRAVNDPYMMNNAAMIAAEEQTLEDNAVEKAAQHASDLEKNVPPKPEKHQKNRWLIPAILACCVLMIGGYAYSRISAYHSHTTVVPDVTNMTVAQAQDALKAANMIPVKGKDQNSDKVDKGLVISADFSGKRVENQTEIMYYVSLGNQIMVPDVSGKKDQEAKSILEAAKLKMTAKLEYSDTIEKGRVISQSPETGSKVNEDDTVTIVISKGQEPIKIDNYVGTNGADAKAALEKLGLVVETTKSFSTSVKKGNVISQNPKSKSSAFKGDTVKLKISKGPEQVKVPDLLGKTESEAKAALKSVGLKLANVNKDYSSSYKEGQVMKQGYDAGEKVDKGTGISIRISLGEEPVVEEPSYQKPSYQKPSYQKPSQSKQPSNDPKYPTVYDGDVEVVN